MSVTSSTSSRILACLLLTVLCCAFLSNVGHAYRTANSNDERGEYYVQMMVQLNRGISGLPAAPVILKVHPQWAPKGAEQFKKLLDAKFFDGCRFFRIIPGFVAQFGMNGDPAVQKVWKSRTIEDDKMGVWSNKQRTLTFATSGENSRTTQLFFNFKDNPYLDSQGFTPFAVVVQGWETIRQLHSADGENPQQGMIMRRGNVYLNSVFPKLSYIESMSIME